MKQVLDPLAAIPGVRTVLLVTPDGVPMMTKGSAHAGDDRRANERTGADDDGASSSEPDTVDAADDPAQLAGLATSWVGEIQRSVGPLSWGPPRYLVLRAARGTLLITEAPGALLVVVLEGGMRSEELRLPMEVAVARMQRHLRGTRASSSPASSDVERPAGIFPKKSHSPDAGAIAMQRTSNGAPEVSGD